MAAVVVEEVKEIAGDFAGGLEADGDFEPLHLGRVAGEEDGLELAGGREVFVETDVFDGAGEIEDAAEAASFVWPERVDIVGFRRKDAEEVASFVRRGYLLDLLDNMGLSLIFGAKNGFVRQIFTRRRPRKS